MYKILLCLRYLKTRYIALACIISVTLGVATMIVVNSVMAGFSSEMRERIHGLLADVIVETKTLDGVQDPELQMRMVREAAGEFIEAMTSTVEVYGMLTFEYPPGNYITQPVTLIGIQPEEKAKVGPLVDYLDSYNVVREGGEVVRQPLRPRDEPPGWELTAEATDYRQARRIRDWLMYQRIQQEAELPMEGPVEPQFEPAAETDAPPFEPADAGSPLAQDAEFPGADPPGDADLVEPGENPFAQAPAAVPAPEALFPRDDEPTLEDLSQPEEARLYVGVNLIGFPYDEEGTGKVKTMMMARPGDNVKISTVSAGRPPEARHFNATIVDVFKSGMSEYDSNLVFCNLTTLQKYRGMLAEDPNGWIEPGKSVAATHEGRKIYGQAVAIDTERGLVRIQPDPAQAVTAEFTAAVADVRPITRAITSIQIKLKDYNDAREVVKRLEATFPPGTFSVRTWEQKQGPLLAAVEVESAILNVLLFLIIAVAGFGILAIFFMIVVEKTRDIGILKALGAGSGGVMSIFLSYGLALGIVGSGVGVVIGLLFVRYINVIESWVTWMTGRKVFDEKIYYFPEIPTSVSPLMVMWVAIGAMTIAVLASVLPARRASRLRPVEALRYE